MQRSDRLTSVTNALKIFDLFSNTKPVIFVSEAAKELNLSKSTVSRLVRTLEAEAYLKKDQQSQGYVLGSKLLTIAGILANSNEIYQEVGPVLSEIVQITKESAHIAALDGTDVFYIQKIHGPYYSKIQTQIGSKNPIHATSSGKVLLAHSSPKTIEKVLQESHKAYTENTITNPIKLKKELDKVKELGYALSIEELTKGNYSLAFPVKNESGNVVCAISIVGPLSRLNQKKLNTYIDILRKSARDASERLGYDI